MNQISPDEAARTHKAIEAINDQWKQRFAQIGNDISLRKWCVENASPSYPPEHVLRFVLGPIADILTPGLPEQSGSQDPDGSKP